MVKLFEEIPSLDLHHFTQGTEEQKQKFVIDLIEAYENIGFIALKNHGLTDQLTHDLYTAITSFFNLPDNVKSQYEIEGLGGQRGYIGKRKEHAKDSNKGDLKEFFHVGQFTTPEDQLDYPDNIWPKEILHFEEKSKLAYQTLEKTGVQILKAIAIGLGLEENYFNTKVSKGNSILRAIHYFPIEDTSEIKEGAVRAAAHGDINLITLLMGASAEGLEVQRRDGKWIAITALPEQIIVNVGDMLERLTNNKLKSTIHRVVNPPIEKLGTSRFSIPFFMHPRAEMPLNCLENCITEENPQAFTDITAGEFLLQRLKEIGLIK